MVQVERHCLELAERPLAYCCLFETEGAGQYVHNPSRILPSNHCQEDALDRGDFHCKLPLSGPRRGVHERTTGIMATLRSFVLILIHVVLISSIIHRVAQMIPKTRLHILYGDIGMRQITRTRYIRQHGLFSGVPSKRTRGIFTLALIEVCLYRSEDLPPQHIRPTVSPFFERLIGETLVNFLGFRKDTRFVPQLP